MDLKTGYKLCSVNFYLHLYQDGDLAAMRAMEALVADGGLLLLAVPVAADYLVSFCFLIILYMI